MALETQVDGTYLGLLAGLLPVSIGMGMSFVPLTLVATTGVADNEAGLASGVFNTSQQVGGALGSRCWRRWPRSDVLWLADLGTAPSAAQQATAAVEGFQLAFYAAAALFVAGTVDVRGADAALRRRPDRRGRRRGGGEVDRDAVAVPA